MVFVTDSNRPQPLWQPPSTAYQTASGATSEIPFLLMHPWGLEGGGGSRFPLTPRDAVLLRLITWKPLSSAPVTRDSQRIEVTMASGVSKVQQLHTRHHHTAQEDGQHSSCRQHRQRRQNCTVDASEQETHRHKRKTNKIQSILRDFSDCSPVLTSGNEELCVHIWHRAIPGRCPAFLSAS